MTRNIIQSSQFLLFILLASIFTFLLGLPSSAHAASCVLSRDLEFGMEGDDVKCIQQYLNANGYTIAATGPGAPGKETGEFKALTEKAIIKWQEANGISPATGFFGTKSRTKYLELVTGTLTTPAPSLVTSQSQVTTVAPTKTNLVSKSTLGPEAVSAEKGVRAALDAIAEAMKLIDDEEVDAASDSLSVAKKDLQAVLKSYFKSDYQSGSVKSKKSTKDTDEDEDTTEKKDTPKKLISDAKSKIKSTQKKIDAAEEDGDDVDDALSQIKKAKNILSDAEDALDEDDEDEAKSLAKDASKAADKAKKALSNSSDDEEDDEDDDVKDLLKKAQKDLKKLKSKLDNALDDDEDVGDAEELLNDADDLLSDAEDALDEDDEDGADDLIKEAKSKIKKAKKEF